MEIVWGFESDSVAAVLSLITYAGVVYATFKLKTEEHRQAYVSLVVCILSVVPPLIALIYNDLSTWQKIVNGCCFCAYALNLVRDIWVHKSLSYFLALNFLVLSAITITFWSLESLGQVQNRALYSAMLSLGAAAAPAFGCLMYTWRFSYMDTYLTMISAIATMLQFLPLMDDDSSYTTFVVLCLTSSIGGAYSLYAYYSMHVANIPDWISNGRSRSERR